jgi:hypothetical protein
MTSRISGQAEICLARADACREMAGDKTYDVISRHNFNEMAYRWQALAESFRVAEEISGYIQWQANRVDAPPEFYE